METVDLAVVGAGAAGLMTAITCARAAPAARIVLVDGARTIGAKILVSGGSRCNVTNTVATERDFWGGSSQVVRRVLEAFGSDRAVAFFAGLGVELHEEEDGKLFPDTNRARSIVDALVGEVTARGVRLHTGYRVHGVTRGDAAFNVTATDGRALDASCVVLATGGRSLPKSGSDGHGYAIASTLGHGFVETTPALAPLLLDDAMHAALSGVSHRGEVTVWIGRRAALRLTGSLLWTHFGASGPVILNASRHWHRARVQGLDVELTLNCFPDETFASCEDWLLGQQRLRSRALVTTALSERIPAAVASALASAAGIDPGVTLSHIPKADRRRLVQCLTEHPLAVHDSRGYNFAEVTAGGVPLQEIDAATMASRRCPGLYLVGEILDVDGRLGGFNFQWAWSTGAVAGEAVARSLRRAEM